LENTPLVSILTVNFNQAEVTCDLIRSLRRMSYQNIEIIVVDNGSQKDDPSSIPERFSDITFLKTGKNLGFAGGNNFGLPYCHGDYVLFINNDVEVEPDFLEPMLAAFAKFPQVGMVSPRIHYFDSPGLIQYAGSTPINPMTMRNAGIGSFEKDTGQYLDSRVTAYIHGACMLVSREVMEKVGFMHEDYFLYYEELDWCHRVSEAGYQIIFEGRSLVHHKESVSVGRASPLKMYYMTRNRLLFARRNFKKWDRIAAMLFFAFFSVPKNVATLILKGQFELIKPFFKGIIWNFSN
jgi:GT2 family glycosyltransferase